MPSVASSSTASHEDSPWPPALGWGILIVALLLRLFWLGMKPPHFDEGVNGFFIDQMRETGLYRYDPSNYHGPLHFYVLYLMQTLLGRSVEVLRLPLVLINVATVWLILQYRRFLPWRLCAWAAVAFAVSPGMLFYSRYAIHEAWLVFALVLTAWGAAELWLRGTTRGLWAMGIGVTLAVLTKETYLIHFAAFGLAYTTLRAFERWIAPSAPGMEAPVPQHWSRSDLATVIATGALWIVFFYSGGFRDFKLLSGMVETFNFWSATGTHGDHNKPVYYWLQLMARYELPALIGAGCAVMALKEPMNRLIRFLAIWGLGVLVAYSIIPYKTPWCIIALLWPFYFLFGHAAVTYTKVNRGRVVYTVLLLALAGSLLQAVRLNYFRPTHDREPYVYVQAPNDLFRLTRPLLARVADHPTTYHGTIHLLMSDYHPLPWVLGDFTRVGYYSRPELKPSEMDGLLIIAEESRMDEVEEAVHEAYFVEPFQIRHGVPAGRLYLNADAFAPYFPARQPELNPEKWHGYEDHSNAPTTP